MSNEQTTTNNNAAATTTAAAQPAAGAEAAAQTNNAAQPAAQAAPTESQAQPQAPATQGKTDAATTQQATGDKLIDPNAAAKSEPAKGEQAKTGAPEKYEPFNLGEGVKLDPSVEADLVSLAKEQGFSQSQAEAVAKLGVKYAQGLRTKDAETLKAASDEWHQQSLNDKEFGGAAYKENLAVAQRGMQAVASPAMQKMLAESGLQTNPEVLRMFIAVGKLVSEDAKLVTSHGNTVQPNAAEAAQPFNMSRLASKIYGNANT